jgi:putative acetyltransferase
VSAWTVREERSGDEAAIAALTEAAFRDQPHSDGSEATIIERLRADGDLALSLVAEDAGGTIVGHVAFSPVTIADRAQGWYGLGPLSVSPARQREGIGSALVRRGLERLADERAEGCVVLGEPAFYGRFGFRHEPRLSYPGPPPEYFQMVAFADSEPEGTVRYAAAFG